MIQRIQTLYLLLAASISGALPFVFYLWLEQSGSQVYSINLFSNPNFLIKSITISFFISALLSFITIFIFKNRQLQFVLCRVNMLINFYLLGILIYVSQTISGEAAVSEKGIGMFLPVLAILLLVFANKAIKKDEDLVKSADRLR